MTTVSLVFPPDSKPRQFHFQRSEKIWLHSWKCHSLLFFVNKLTPPLSYFCTHEMGWRCQDIFATSLNSLWFHFIPPVSWYFAFKSQFFGFDLLRSTILLAVPVFEDFKSKSWSFCKKKHWKESSQGSMCCPTGDTSLIWATFSQRNLWQLKMTTIVTNLWSPKIQNHRRYWVEISGPDNLVPDIASDQTKNHLLLPFCGSIFQRPGWQRSENLKWKRPALLYKAHRVYKKQYSVVTEKKGTRHHMTCVWDLHTTSGGPFSQQP